MNEAVKKQVVIVLVLWTVHVSALVACSTIPDVAYLVDWCGLVNYDSFSIALISLLSVIAVGLNIKLGRTPRRGGWRSHVVLIAQSILIANVAFWLMTVPAFMVLTELGMATC